MKKLSILVVAGLLCLMTLPAFAQDKADWAFYGSVRMWTSWESWDQELPTAFDPGSPSTKRIGNYVSAIGASTRYDDSDLWWGQMYGSRIGANVKWGNVAGRFEYGHQTAEGSSTNADTTHVRLLYADWNFGSGILRIGQDYTPYMFTVSSMCGPSGGDCSGIGFGSLYAGRKDQLKLIMGGFQFALIEPQVTTASLRTANWTQTAAFAARDTNLPNDTDRIIPKIEASYTFNLGPAALFIGGGYNTYDAVYVTGAGVEKEISVDSWGLGIGTKIPIGPFYINAAFQYLVNPGNYGFGQNAPVALATLEASSNPTLVGGTEDVTVWSGALVMGFNVTNTLSFEGGVLYLNGSTDSSAALTGTLPYGLGVEYNIWTYYINATWSPAKNVFIQPEIGLIDFGDAEIDNQADDDLGDLFYVGIKWMINF